MTKRIEKGRHRAAASASSFEILSRAVASNAGAMGRQAAVVAAASGLVVTLGVSGANATKQDQATTPEETKTLNVERTASVKPADIKAEAKAAPIASVKVKATPAPVVEEVEEADEPAASSANSAQTESTESGLTEADFAAQVSADGSTAAATAPATSSPAPKKKAEKDTPAPKSASGIAGTALSYKGAPYVWGGTTPSGWDCSGFVRYVYAQNGINLKGRSTHAMLASGQLKRVSNPQPGDLVFQNGNNHVGIYIGGGKIIGAQNPKVGTVIRPANSPYGPLTGYYRVG
ncbi:NlpC/P60 family protein [Pseudoglutamicibacter albus]|uniref:NlpC/P60 family protein n=1 Tax=Pseudoglutamicibacter cumminsii TaxID=156979 RepID=A0AAP4FGE9_9MICC|nr:MULTISPECIES: C40 family peptidase [Pseudoglutamicibacter]MDK6274827.1 NlpC/P60 family protein [Pseudoglutamicibacter cumminsii]MDK7083693.1 NlpC/P60 family protein [Pseudoglutamicibacter cumminsii]MDZ3746201.1 NlpC/P60 family protein [Pseudoglutamicibacter cumminsii]WIK84873.1 NlpC/P60 family protein [Pseudoglutamicibacter albus]